MKCKFCEAELEEGITLCPECGKENAEPEEVMPVQEETALEFSVEEEPTVQEHEVVSVEQTEEMSNVVAQEDTSEKPVRKPFSWQGFITGAAAALLMVVLAILLLFAFKDQLFPQKEETPAGTEGTQSEETVFVSDVDYTGTEEQAAEAADTVVAEMNGKKLTNRALQLYYNVQVGEFLNNNYSYLVQLGLDYTKPLNEQMSYYDQEKSWEAYFVETAIKTWQNYQAVAMLAEEAGYELDEEAKQSLEKLPADLEEMAKENGLENAEALIQQNMGANCTLEDYVEYCTLYYIGSGFTSQEPAMEELEKYFEENKDSFAENGITKESGPIVDVRHILLSPEGGTEGKDGTKTYTEEEWDACLEKAEDLLQQWNDGEATEDTFAELATSHSADGGSNTNGGLYTGITSETNFVEPFLNWCMDESRQVGDTGIVKTDYGYHIMFFSYTEPQWIYHATTQYIADQTTKHIEEATQKWPIETNYDKLCIAEFKLA